MKISPVLSTLGFSFLFFGCTASHSSLVLAPVGPTPAPAANSSQGSLVVYSAFRVNADFNNPDPYRREYSDYRILSPDGNLLQRVHNDSGSIGNSPTHVTLAAGNYRVIARANGFGTVTVPVVIEPGRTTTLHLEGGGSWPNHAVFGETNAVRLPDGRIVGWRSETGGQS